MPGPPIENELHVVSLDDDGHTESVGPSARQVDTNVERAPPGEQPERVTLNGGRSRTFIIKTAFVHPGSTTEPLNEDDNMGESKRN